MPFDIQAAIDKSVRQRQAIEAMVADYCNSATIIAAHQAWLAERDATIAELKLQIVALKSQLDQGP